MPRPYLSAEFALILDSAVRCQVVSAFSQHLQTENIAICTAKAVLIPALDPDYERSRTMIRELPWKICRVEAPVICVNDK